MPPVSVSLPASRKADKRHDRPAVIPLLRRQSVPLLCDSAEVAVVLERLRVELAARRRAGEPFEEAWRLSLSAAVPTGDPDGWRPALLATRDAWRRTYERAPATPAERALHLVVDNGDREPLESMAA